MNKIYIKTFGCKSNYAELFNTFVDLNNSSIEVTQLKKLAQLDEANSNDIVIVNTCVVTRTAEKECISTIKRIIARYPNLYIYLTGCLINSDSLRSQLGYLLNEKCVIADSNIIKELLVSHLELYPHPRLSVISPGFMSHTRGFLKIQDGCRCFCNYCIVPHVRPWCSVSHDIIINRFQNMINNGYKEIVLTGINIGTYGKAPGAGKQITFSELLSQLLKLAQGKTRIRISSIEPEDVTDEILDIFKDNSKLCSHLHLPLQSGSDKVLTEMNRKCSRTKYLEVVKKFRLASIDRAVSADILIGYPTETEEDFLQTLSLISQLELERVHIFTYSPRPGTAPANLTPLSREVLIDRKDRIFSHTKKVTNISLQRFINSSIEVLTEEQHTYYTLGLGNSYQQVKIYPSVPIGDLIKVQLTAFDEQWFRGKQIG